jgi:type VI secretion system FHA domain protein
MVVVSKVNPVMVKGRRYGPGTRLVLHSGDSFEVAEYEVQVMLPEPIENLSEPDAPVVKAPPPSNDPLMQVLSSTHTHSTPLHEQDPAERLFNESTFFGGDEPTPTARAIPPEETFVPKARPAAAPPKPAPMPASVPASGMSNALRAFLEGAGVPHKELSPADSERMLRDCGAILRAAVEGIMMLLLARGEMRKEFEAEERTMVAARDNNPLKLMSDPHEAMDFLFDPAERTDGFLDPVQAIGDACEDLRAHELALMAGMRGAILGALRRFDPQALEKIVEKAGGFSFGGRKAKLWEAFVAHQQKLAQEAQEDFDKVFGRDFMAAYQSQLRKLKTGR